MNYRLLISLAAMTLTMVGCANNASQPDNPHADLGAAPSNAFDSDHAPVMTAATHFAAGQLAESRGDLAAAVSQYKEALRIDKNHQPALYRLGCVHVQQHDYASALATWNRYLKATDESAFAYSNLAYTEELAGQPARAEHDYKLGIAKDPENEPCRVNYGLMLARHGHMNEAIIQLQAVLDPAEVHYDLGTVYELQHRKEQARLEYKRSVALDPDFADAKQKLASIGED